MSATAEFASDITKRMRLVAEQSDQTANTLGALWRKPRTFGEAAHAALESARVLCMMMDRSEADGGPRRDDVRESAARILASIELTRVPTDPDTTFMLRMLQLLTEVRSLFVRNVRWQDGSQEEECDRVARGVIAELRSLLNRAKVRL